MLEALENRLYKLQDKGWSYVVGYNKAAGGYYAQAWRQRLERIMVDGNWSYIECITIPAKTEREALSTLIERLESLGEITKEPSKLCCTCYVNHRSGIIHQVVTDSRAFTPEGDRCPPLDKTAEEIIRDKYNEFDCLAYPPPFISTTLSSGE